MALKYSLSLTSLKDQVRIIILLAMHDFSLYTDNVFMFTFVIITKSTLLIGLGTSSILGGCNLAALYRAMGEEHDHDSLVHAVSFVCKSNQCMYACIGNVLATKVYSRSPGPQFLHCILVIFDIYFKYHSVSN